MSQICSATYLWEYFDTDEWENTNNKFPGWNVALLKAPKISSYFVKFRRKRLFVIFKSKTIDIFKSTAIFLNYVYSIAQIMLKKYSQNCLKINELISTGADGGPPSRVCPHTDLPSAPYQHQRKFFVELDGHPKLQNP